MKSREHWIRGGFSFIAAASLIYMAAEFAEDFIRRRRLPDLVLALATAGLSAWEAYKVGRRLEAILGLRSWSSPV